MIPLLCDYDTIISKNFKPEKIIGHLPDAIDCVVVEELNGSYYLDMKYPSNGICSESLVVFNFILAKPYDGGKVQPFIITRISGIGSDMISVHAEHIIWLASKMVVMPFVTETGGGASNIWEKINSRLLPASKRNFFNFSASPGIIPDFSEYFIDYYSGKQTPLTLIEVLNKPDVSIRGNYGHDYTYDWYDIFLDTRGSRKDFQIRFGVNMLQCEYDISIEDRADSFVYFWNDKDIQDRVNFFPHNMSDWTEDAENKLTIGTSGKEMFTVIDANNLVKSDGSVDINKVSKSTKKTNPNMWKDVIDNIEVDFINIENTIEYKDFSEKNNLQLGDYISVVHPMYHISINERIMKTEYDVLLERYKKMTLGVKKVTLYDAIASGRYKSANAYYVED